MSSDSGAVLILADADQVAGTVSEPVTLDNANAMSEAGGQFIADSPEVLVHLDMQHVDATSVAVAVVLAWFAVAARCGKELCLANLSSDFSNLVEFSGISSMFAEHIQNPS